MAIETGLLLFQGVENPVAFAVYLVTGCTCDTFNFVCTAEPAKAAFSLVTVEADPVLFRDRRLGRSAKSPHRLFCAAPALRPRMFFARAVTGLALQIRKRSIRVGPGSVFCLENGCGGLFRAVLMTQDA